jgi:hypothetical protein
LKRLYFAASIAITITMLSTPLRAGAFGSPRIAPSVESLPLSTKIAKSAKAVATRSCTVGWCYRGVKEALANVGVALTGPAAWMAKSQLLTDLRFVMVPLKTLKTGDILVHGRWPAHPYGHIAVYLGNNQEASDHVQKLVLGHGYGETVVFRASDKTFRAAAANTVTGAPQTVQAKPVGTVPTVAQAKPTAPVLSVAHARPAGTVDAVTQARQVPHAQKIAHATAAPVPAAGSHRSTCVMAAAHQTGKRRTSTMLAYAGSRHSRPVSSH